MSSHKYRVLSSLIRQLEKIRSDRNIELIEADYTVRSSDPVFLSSREGEIMQPHGAYLLSINLDLKNPRKITDA